MQTILWQYGLPPAEIAQAEAAFFRYDTDKSGILCSPLSTRMMIDTHLQAPSAVTNSSPSSVPCLVIAWATIWWTAMPRLTCNRPTETGFVPYSYLRRRSFFLSSVLLTLFPSLLFVGLGCVHRAARLTLASSWISTPSSSRYWMAKTLNTWTRMLRPPRVSLTCWWQMAGGSIWVSHRPSRETKMNQWQLFPNIYLFPDQSQSCPAAKNKNRQILILFISLFPSDRGKI